VAKVQLVEKAEIYVTSIIAIIIFFVFNELLILIVLIYFGIYFQEEKKLLKVNKLKDCSSKLYSIYTAIIFNIVHNTKYSSRI
jgi:hypothetical protein